MLLTDPHDIAVLRRESLLMISDSDYRSESLFRLFGKMIRSYYSIRGYYRYPKHVLEQAELACTIKLVKAIPKYKQGVADAARQARGLEIDIDRSLSTYIETVIRNTCYDVFAHENACHPHTVTFVSLVTADGTEIDVPDPQSLDIDTVIDRRAARIRAADFNRRLTRNLKDHKMPEPREDEAYFAQIASKYTKVQLVEKTLAAFQQLSHILQLVQMAVPDTENITPVQRALIQTAKAREAQAKAAAELHSLVLGLGTAEAEAQKEVEDA